MAKKKKSLSKAKEAANLMKSVGKKPRRGHVITCANCSTMFYVTPCHSGRKYCSKDCSVEALRKEKMVNKPITCAHCKKEFYCSRSQEKLRNRKHCSRRCYALARRGKNVGSENPFYKHGRSLEARKARYCAAAREWRLEVFKRDNWTCQLCGARSKAGDPVTLNADHIKPFSRYPELRYEISNGRTLCLPCHKNTPTYGNPKTWSEHVA